MKLEYFVQSLWKSLVFHYLLNVCIFDGLEIPPLDGYIIEIHLYVHLETHARIFIATISTTKNKLETTPLIVEKNLVHTFNGILYSKENERAATTCNSMNESHNVE